jgi:hypothetical protein
MSSEQAYAEMEEAFGLAPSFFPRMPDATVEFEWKLFQDSDENGEIVFRHVALPGDAEVARVTERVCRQVSKLLDRRGLGPQASHEEPDALQHSQPLLAELYSASISGRAATGPRAGRRVGKVGDTIDWEDSALPAVPLGLRASP